MIKIHSKEFTVDIADHRVFVKTWTPSVMVSDAPLILFHDSLGCVELWKNFPQRLAQKLSRRVIAYDRIGYGYSDGRRGRASKQFIEEEAQVYFPLIKKAFGLTRYAVLGHSVGGSMAINVAAFDRDCEAVISMSAQAFVEDITIRGVRQAQQAFKQPEQIAKLEKWHGDKAQWILHAWIDTWLAPDFAHWNLLEALQRLHCPVLAIHGDQDEFGSSAFPKFIIDNAADESAMLLLENCGHMPHKECSNEVFSAVIEFLGASQSDTNPQQLTKLGRYVD